MTVDTHEIATLLRESKEPDEKTLSLILKEAEKGRGLGLEESAVLLSIKDPAKLKLLCDKAGEVKQKIFGRRIVLFAPLYLSNYCKNSCLYCAFRSPNRNLPRKALSEKEVIREASALEGMGFKRILLVTGEDPARGLDYIVRSVRAIYGNTAIRIVHVNAPPMDVEALGELKKSRVGVYQVFQETYHRPTYEFMHPTGPKKDYDYRLTVMDRAFKAGFEDVGIGCLLGLYDFRFDVLSTIVHSKRLFEEFGAHAHTMSVPRLRPADGASLPPSAIERYMVSDEELKKIVAVYRLSAPQAGVVISTREGAGLRNSLVNGGASQMSAASRTDPGGYSAPARTLEQFSTLDRRSLIDVMVAIMEEGGLPSLCTTCYRRGRVGKDFARITTSGEMEKFCRANAILTLKEYILDNPLNGLKDVFLSAIEREIAEIKEPAIKQAVSEGMERLEKGERDVHL